MTVCGAEGAARELVLAAAPARADLAETPAACSSELCELLHCARASVGVLPALVMPVHWRVSAPAPLEGSVRRAVVVATDEVPQRLLSMSVQLEVPEVAIG